MHNMKHYETSHVTHTLYMYAHMKSYETSHVTHTLCMYAYMTESCITIEEGMGLVVHFPLEDVAKINTP